MSKMPYISLIIKRPTRDTCLCIGGNQAPPAPVAPPAYNSVTVGRNLFKFGRRMQ